MQEFPGEDTGSHTVLGSTDAGIDASAASTLIDLTDSVVEATFDHVPLFDGDGVAFSNPLEQELNEAEDVLHGEDSRALGGFFSDAHFDGPFLDLGAGSSDLGLHSEGVDNDIRSFASEEQLGDAGFDHATTQRGLKRTLETSGPKFFWEQDNFLAVALGPEKNIVDELFGMQAFKRPAEFLVETVEDEVDKPIVAALKKGTRRPIYMTSTGKISAEIDSTKRQSVLSGWTSLVLTEVAAFKAFDSIPAFDGRDSFRSEVLQCVTECLAVKATSTLEKRLGSLMRYASFCDNNSYSGFPLGDNQMYSYLSRLNADPTTAATTGRSFREAARFAAAMLGLRGLRENAVSRRVTGLAEMLVGRSSATLQASPLTVEQVTKLEMFCCTTDALQDRLLSGGVLVMLYGCARASDVARGIGLSIDCDLTEAGPRSYSEPAGYIEVSVVGNKGARSKRHKQLILPVVAPMITVGSSPWWESWLEARCALGVGTEGELDYPLLCKFDLDGRPQAASLSASEIGEYLRQILGISTQSRNLVRSHSLKTTCLSWTAKAGVPIHLRRNLGHHLDVSSKSAECYARDAVAPQHSEPYAMLLV